MRKLRGSWDFVAGFERLFCVLRRVLSLVKNVFVCGEVIVLPDLFDGDVLLLGLVSGQLVHLVVLLSLVVELGLLGLLLDVLFEVKWF